MYTSSPRDVVMKYHNAWTSGDLQTAMSYVADTIHCQAPGIELNGKEMYKEYIGRFAPNLIGIENIAEFSNGQQVALFYYPQTAVTTTAPAAECFTVQDGEIIASVLIFDRLSFSPPNPN
ncbi:nuclear transport factor 2 family protein [Corynebacterium freiburgense]|uniref:nuclear transport factor 2 family protein n=1 Tax=Corynebacterium freiburgense TaxID=556548 RepID=UPI00041A2478|nr:nuclear transport factor 2 family protein [Corynebacterium freiburgense]WJZ01654.1 SnoaL-like domain protein [Corynebacterium freiburgense]